ncbi:MAG: hypothetical protein WB988_04425 [Candidatus Nitrosopolaris sp.]
MFAKRIGTTNGGWGDMIRWYWTVAVIRTLLKRLSGSLNGIDN